jgi:hypothetical protein
MALLGGTVVNVAVPTIGRELHAGLADQQWVLDGSRDPNPVPATTRDQCGIPTSCLAHSWWT